MKKIILILLIKIFFFSQVPSSFAWDTTAAKFYPLAVGNSYTFVQQELYSQFCTPTWILGIHRIKISRDTILSNGKKYFVLDGSISYPANYWKYQRIDSSTMNVYLFDANTSQERLMDSLRAQVGDTFKCARFQGSWGRFANIYTGMRFGQIRTERYIPARTTFPTQILNYTLLEGIGFSGYATCELGGVQYYLKGCVINGVVYGDTSLTNVQQIGSSVPDKYSLHQNYPNPFNPSTKIEFSVPSNVKGQTSNVRLIIYDISGKELEILVNQNLNPGSYKIQWNASEYSSGVYFYKLETSDFKDVKRMVILK